MPLFATMEEYESNPDQADVESLVIDVRLPGMSGLELRELVRAVSRPMRVITAQEGERGHK
jgi:FixJ family two-component response regulator